MCIYCDYCVYHYKSTELVSLYTLDIGLKINIIIIIVFGKFKSLHTPTFHAVIQLLNPAEFNHHVLDKKEQQHVLNKFINICGCK